MAATISAAASASSAELPAKAAIKRPMEAWLENSSTQERVRGFVKGRIGSPDIGVF